MFGAVEPSRTHAKLPLRPASPFTLASRRCGAVEPPRTHSKLPFRPASPYSTVVRGGSVQSNLPELTANYLSGQLPTSSQCFEGVWCRRTAPKSLKLSCRPASPVLTVVRGGSVGSNRPKRTPTFPVGLFTPSSQ